MSLYFLLRNESSPVTVRAKLPHAAIPQEDIVWLHDYMNTEGHEVTFDSAIHIMKRKLFPSHYDPSPWVQGENMKHIIFDNNNRSVHGHYLIQFFESLAGRKPWSSRNRLCRRTNIWAYFHGKLRLLCLLYFKSFSQRMQF